MGSVEGSYASSQSFSYGANSCRVESTCVHYEHSSLVMQQPAHITTRIVAADSVCAGDIDAWAALESRAIEPNAFLSPHFIIPSARHLTPQQVPHVLIVERQVAAVRQLIGIGIFTETRATRQVPMRSLIGYRSRHSFLSGLLLDREFPEQAFEAMLGFIGKRFPWCRAVGMSQVWSDGPMASPGGVASKACDFSPLLTQTAPRAILRPTDCRAHLRDKALAKRIRDLDRRQRRLSQLGEVDWRFHRAEAIPAESIEAFLALENMGWKAEEGSSLRSRPEDEAFFRDMVAAFASDRRVMFAELTLDGVPIASICNLVSGNVGFCFKIGWDPAFRSTSPALINELEFMRNAETRFGDIEYFDSGAGAESFINELWLARRDLSTMVVPTGTMGASTLHAVGWARRLMRSVRRSEDALPV
jgi:CelD/BcsL family acetyltransferase involved in cellulose biosynthesis